MSTDMECSQNDQNIGDGGPLENKIDEAMRKLCEMDAPHDMLTSSLRQEIADVKEKMAKRAKSSCELCQYIEELQHSLSALIANQKSVEKSIEMTRASILSCMKSTKETSGALSGRMSQDIKTLTKDYNDHQPKLEILKTTVAAEAKKYQMEREELQRELEKVEQEELERQQKIFSHNEEAQVIENRLISAKNEMVNAEQKLALIQEKLQISEENLPISEEILRSAEDEIEEMFGTLEIEETTKPKNILNLLKNRDAMVEERMKRMDVLKSIEEHIIQIDEELQEMAMRHENQKVNTKSYQLSVNEEIKQCEEIVLDLQNEIKFSYESTKNKTNELQEADMNIKEVSSKIESCLNELKEINDIIQSNETKIANIEVELIEKETKLEESKEELNELTKKKESDLAAKTKRRFNEDMLGSDIFPDSSPEIQPTYVLEATRKAFSFGNEDFDGFGCPNFPFDSVEPPQREVSIRANGTNMTAKPTTKPGDASVYDLPAEDSAKKERKSRAKRGRPKRYA